MNSPSIVFLKSHLMSGGGLEKYTRRLASAFVDRGCDVRILTTDYEPCPSDSYEIISLGPRHSWSVRHLWQFNSWAKHWLRNHSCDVVFGMGRNGGFQTHYRAGDGVHAQYLKRRALTDPFWKRWSFRLNPLHRTILRLERECFESPRLRTLFCNSSMIRREIQEHFKISGHKLQVVHNGVEWQEWTPFFCRTGEERKQIQCSLGLDPSSFQFLFIGHGFQRKGLEFLLRGLSRLSHRDFQLSVVGEDKNLEQFKRLTLDLGLKKRVHFFGKQASTVDFYTAADCLAIPSTYDPFANVTVEALAMGLFVISSPSNGASEILTPHSGVVLEELEDSSCMEAALEKALERPKSPRGAEEIRNSIAHLDFKEQLKRIVDSTLSSL